MTATKGNGPDAANIRPAKTQTKYATDFIAAISPIPAFLSPVSVNLHVADVADVAALIHKGFLLQRHHFSGVADVAASAGYVLNPPFTVFIHTERFNFIQIPYESIQPPRRYFRAGAGAGQQFDQHAKLSFRRGHHAAARCCAKVPATSEMKPVLENIVIDNGAFTHALSWVFSRPNTLVYGRDGLVREAGRMAYSMFLTSRPPYARRNANGGLQSQYGAETMTTVNTTTTPVSGNKGPAPTLPRITTVESALRAILSEVTPGVRPYSGDSWLPAHLIQAAQAALDGTDTAAQQHAHNALSMAAWHCARGEPAQALARLRRAQSHIKASMEGGAA